MAKSGIRNRLFSFYNIYLTIAVISLVFVNLLSINTVGISSAQLDNITGRATPGPISNTTISTYSSSVYLIPSTSVQLNTFSANYTIAGTTSSVNDSKDLITSTIVNDFDKNPNIGYIVNSSSSQKSIPAPSPSSNQPSLPNPFLGQDLINQKIINQIQGAIAAAASSSEHHIEIKCTFGMILDNYKCS